MEEKFHLTNYAFVFMNDIKSLDMQNDLQFVRSILPDHYTVQEGKKKGSIHCKSEIGIRHKIDAEDDEHWHYVFSAIKQKFGKRFQEVFHNVSFCHTDFIIYLKAIPC